MTTSIPPSITTYNGTSPIAPLTASDIGSFSQIVYSVGTVTGGGGTGYYSNAISNNGNISNPITLSDNTNYNFSYPVENNVKIHGDAEFSGDIKLQGKSLTNIIEQIEQRLAILHPNPELESRWNELADLRMKYLELEREIIEKEQIWATLKK